MIGLLCAVLLLGQAPPGVRGNATVTGEIRAADGAPARAVRVTASPSGDASSFASIAETDVSGRYRLENIPPGRYYVAAGIVGQPTYYPGVSDLTAAAVLIVSAGGTYDNVNFPLARPAGVRITGRVVQGDPAVHMLRLYAIGKGDALQTVKVAPDRSFEFVRVPPGQYSIAVDSQHAVWSSKPMDVGDAEIADLELRLTPFVRVIGHATVNNGGPLPEFGLSFKGPLGWSSAGAGFLNRQDNAFYVVMPVGEYNVIPAMGSGGYRMESLTYRGRDLLQEPVRMTGAVEQLSVRFSTAAIPPWRRVRGRLTGLRNIPRWTGPLRVDLYQDQGGLWGEAPLNDDGSFEFPKVLPGAYRIIPPGLRPSAVVIGSADIDSLEFDVLPHWQVTGQIVLESGETPPLSSYDVMFSTSQGAEYYSNRKNDSFSALLPEGDFTIRVNVPSTYEVSSVLQGLRDLKGEPLTVSGKEDDIRVILRPRKVRVDSDVAPPQVSLSSDPIVAVSVPSEVVLRKVSGRITGVDLQQKVLLNDGFGREFESTLDDKGAFEFPKVGPGVYRLALKPADPFVPEKTIVVAENDIANIEAAIPQQRAVRGRVLVDGEGVLPSVALVAWYDPTLGKFQGFTPRGGFGIPLNIAADGTFEISMPEGAHRVEVTGFPARFYRLSSVAFGSANLLTNPLNVVGPALPELVIKLALVEPETMATVRGKMSGVSKLSSPARLSLSVENPLLAPAVFYSSPAPDGSFEISQVPPGTYSLGTDPPVAGMLRPEIVVGERQIVQADLAVPSTIQMKVRVRAEGSAAVSPRFTLAVRLNTGESYRIQWSPMFTFVQPQGFQCIGDVCTPRPLGLHLNEPAAVSGSNTADTFDILLPEGEHEVEFTGFPSGFRLKSAMQGTVDLLRNPLRVGNGPAEILVTFEQ